MFIRQAIADDAEAVADVLRRSIRELCGGDHGDDPERLEAWLANKRPDEVRAWLAMPGVLVLVAEEAGAILAVGALKQPDTVLLNYVAPEARFSGLSHAVLVAMEAELRAGGTDRVRLTSTRTAERFYRERGYTSDADATVLGVAGLDMVKELGF